MNEETKLFGKDMNLSKVMDDIYRNSKSKDEQIANLINDLKELITTVNDAIVIVPLISEYLQISVKNDQHLVNLGVLMQRYVTAQQKIEATSKPTEEGQLMLSESEKAAIFKELDMIQEDKKIPETTSERNEFVEDIKETIKRKAEEEEKKMDLEDEDEDVNE